MTEVRDIGRVAIDGLLRMARAPLGAAAQLLPEHRGQRDAALLAIDRADAAVRSTVGGLLRDDALRDDAGRRRAAVDERVRALELRRQADETKRIADAHLAAELDAGTELRSNAQSDAQQRRRQVAQQRTEQQRLVTRLTDAEMQAAEDARDEALASTDKQAKHERLRVLDEQAAALDQQADAITARDEAERLRNAASAIKAERKGTA